MGLALAKEDSEKFDCFDTALSCRNKCTSSVRCLLHIVGQRLESPSHMLYPSKSTKENAHDNHKYICLCAWNHMEDVTKANGEQFTQR